MEQRMKLEFVALGLPKPAGSKTGFVMTNKKTGKQRAVIVDACKTTKPWQAVVSNAAMDALQKLSPEDAFRFWHAALAVSFRFYIPRPKNHFNSKGEVKASAPTFIKKRPDVLKYSRGVEDAMTAIVYADDSQIVDEFISKHYGTPARVEVCIKTLE
jgi:Holliday junction resolvase RusA-like endonuclease